MIGWTLLLLIGSPGSELTAALQRCQRDAEPLRCLKPHLDLSAYAARVLIDVPQTSTTGQAMNGALVARLERHLEGKLASLRGDVECQATPAGREEALEVLAVECRRGERRYRGRAFGRVDKGRFVVVDLEVKGALISRSQRAQVNKLLRNEGEGRLLLRIRAPSTLASGPPLELGLSGD